MVGAVQIASFLSDMPLQEKREREEMVRWREMKFPETKVLALNPPQTNLLQTPWHVAPQKLSHFPGHPLGGCFANFRSGLRPWSLVITPQASISIRSNGTAFAVVQIFSNDLPKLPIRRNSDPGYRLPNTELTLARRVLN